MSKKPRKWSINVQFPKPVTVLGIKRLPDGTIEHFDNGVPLKPETVDYEVGYDREKKNKVINKIVLEPNRISVNPYVSLKKFDFIYAIDTNTKVVNDKVISISSIILCTLDFGKDGIITVQYELKPSLEFWNIKHHPENIAWMKLIQAIIQNPTYDPNWKTGIVVDSDLGNLPVYNARSIPIYSDFYLPENFELIYASAEVGKREYLVNNLIALCEHMAKSLLKKLSLNEIPDTGLKEVSNEPYTHFRFWGFSNHPIDDKTVLSIPYIDK
jgi:hypothetical protein